MAHQYIFNTFCHDLPFLPCWLHLRNLLLGLLGAGGIAQIHSVFLMVDLFIEHSMFLLLLLAVSTCKIPTMDSKRPKEDIERSKTLHHRQGLSGLSR